MNVKKKNKGTRNRKKEKPNMKCNVINNHRNIEVKKVEYCSIEEKKRDIFLF